MANGMTTGDCLQNDNSEVLQVGKNMKRNMKVVCKRFLDSGMTPEQVAKRMDVPVKFINACMR